VRTSGTGSGMNGSNNCPFRISDDVGARIAPKIVVEACFDPAKLRLAA
jgi:hypothetical protein